MRSTTQTDRISSFLNGRWNPRSALVITDNNLLTLILSDHMDERESGMFHSTGRWRELPGEIWFQGMKNPKLELGMFQGPRGMMEVSVRDSLVRNSD